MEGIKYVDLCTDYEEKIKVSCDTIIAQNKDYCENLKSLLQDCYKFKEKKMKHHTKDRE